ncbi:MAG TPA: hypothetical protein VFL80_00040 [Thermoanaerobaculia bacterium]|nr:hypothetical protein [Thermoanaerobaculia bacterium]
MRPLTQEDLQHPVAGGPLLRSTDWRALIVSVAGVALLLLTEGCRQTIQQPAEGVRPRVRATVIDIQTTLKPENRTVRHFIAVANGVARSSDELDQWRLYDLKGKRVTFVDAISRTVRHESLQSLAEKRSTRLRGSLGTGIPRASAITTGERRTIGGLAASRVAVTVGAYRRDLWIAPHPAIPPELFSMMHVSETVTTPLAPMMRDAHNLFANVRGIPLIDRSEVPQGKGPPLVVERTVIGISQREIPADWFTAPRSYRDVTPPPAPRRTQRPPRTEGP